MESSARRRINLIHRHLLSPPCEFNNALNPVSISSLLQSLFLQYSSCFRGETFFFFSLFCDLDDIVSVF